MKYYIKRLPDEMWWGGAVSEGVKMPFGQGEYAFNGTVNLTDNQYNGLFVSDRGRYIYVENGCNISASPERITISEAHGVVDVGENYGTLKNAYRAAMKKYFMAARRPVPEDTILAPQYCTWVEMLRSVDQRQILTYARSIVDAGMPVGCLIVDDGWAVDYGDWRFRPDRFPDPAAMIRELKSLGFTVILWVCPFVNRASRDFGTLCEEGALVRDARGRIAERHWWSGISAVLDMTSPAAERWMRGQLGALTAMGVDGFKFDAGDAQYYESDDRTYAPTSPNGQCALWAKFAAQYAYAELRACVGLAGYPIVQRLSDKSNVWDGPKGLASLIPNMLQAGLVGYSYCCPDMIGGGNEVDFGPGSEQDEELMLRSCACAALMPMMQFSYAVWTHSSDSAVKRIVREYSRLRLRYCDYLRGLLKEHLETGDPLMRHMEYEFPGQGFAPVNDQFMLGPALLVAPVLRKGATGRTVRLPAGSAWRYVPTGKTYTGGEITVPAPLDTLPYFEKI